MTLFRTAFSLQENKELISSSSASLQTRSRGGGYPVYGKCCNRVTAAHWTVTYCKSVSRSVM